MQDVSLIPIPLSDSYHINVSYGNFILGSQWFQSLLRLIDSQSRIG